MKESSAKKSIIIGGLIGTGGLFISKLIGLAYTIPLSYIMGSEAYMSIYGMAYNIYAYLLTIFQSGIPFAVATLVARYMAWNDVKSVLLVKKISFGILALTGFVGMLLLFGLSGVFAPLMAAENVDVMARSLQILAIAVFLVPVLSAFRGYYQGLKEMEEYAFSQVFEQIFRVGFLLSMACVFVYLLNFDNKWALYIAVSSTSIAAIAAIVQFYRFDKKKHPEMLELASKQEKDAVDTRALLKEIAILAIPYLFVAILGNIDQLFNSFLLPTGLRMHGYSVKEQTTITSAVTYVSSKLNAIPMILGPGFATAIIPHISAALADKDMKLVRKDIKDCLNIVLYVAIPVSFCILIFAKPLNYTLYYSSNLDLSSYVVAWMAIEGFLSTVSPVVTNLMVALELRKSVVKRLVISTIIKAALMVPCMMIFGIAGAVISSLIGYGYLIYFNLREIKEVYHVSYRSTLILTIRMLISLLGLWIVFVILNKIGLGGSDGSKIVCLIKMLLNGALSALMYLAISIYFKVPQSIFHIQISDVKDKLLKRGA